MKTVKLTSTVLRKIVLEELEKIRKERLAEGDFGDMEPVEDRAKEAKEVDADEYADTLAQHVDMMKALKIKESKLRRQLAAVEEQRRKVSRSR